MNPIARSWFLRIVTTAVFFVICGGTSAWLPAAAQPYHVTTCPHYLRSCLLLVKVIGISPNPTYPDRGAIVTYQVENESGKDVIAEIGAVIDDVKKTLPGSLSPVSIANRQVVTAHFSVTPPQQGPHSVGVLAQVYKFEQNCCGRPATKVLDFSGFAWATLTVQNYNKLVHFDDKSVVGFNPQPGFDPRSQRVTYCGSSTQTFFAEYEQPDMDIHKITVKREWGPLWGNDVYVQGTVVETDVSGNDFAFAHPFSLHPPDYDQDIGVILDPPYSGLHPASGNGQLQQNLGLELERGLIPHDPSGAPDPIPAYTPQNGDSFIAVGPWIMDCGHSDYHVEVHAPRFLAFAHRNGDTTIAHLFFVPYALTQYYKDSPDNLWSMGNAAKLLPDLLADQLTALGWGQKYSPLEAHAILELNTDKLHGVSWFICAPPISGNYFRYSYHLATRSHVSLAITPQPGIGCLQFTLGIPLRRDAFNQDPLAFVPMFPQRQNYNWPWTEIKKESGVDVQAIIYPKIPNKVTRQYVDDNHPPIIDSYPPLRIAQNDQPDSYTHRDDYGTDSQPFPIYGWVEVTWSNRPLVPIGPRHR